MSKFQEVAEAYETLENDKKRQEYDNYGHVDEQQESSGRSRGGNPFQGGGFSYDMSDFDMSEDIFDFFSGGNRRDQGKGRDINVKIRLSFLDAVNGCNKDVKYESITKDQTKKGMF